MYEIRENQAVADEELAIILTTVSVVLKCLARQMIREGPAEKQTKKGSESYNDRKDRTECSDRTAP